MQYPKWEISKEEFDQLSQLTPVELSDKIKEEIPIHWKCGYGWYGCSLIKDDGKYYIRHSIGETCD